MSTDLERLRRDVSLSDAAARYGIALQNDGHEYVACCPFHSEDTPSFTVFAGKDGISRFHCFGCGEKGDVLDFVQKIKGVELREAVRILGGASAGPNVAPRKIEARDPYAGIEPIDPPDEPIVRGKRVKLYNPKRKGEQSEWGGFAPSMVFPYCLADGSLFGYVLRHELPGGDKETPMVRYGVERVADGKQVIVVEGEKCADALRRETGRCVVSWAGGTQGVKHADWSPLAGHSVIIWPDADQPGLDAANAIAAILGGLGCAVRVLAIDCGKPKGWDAADAVDDGWTKAGLDAFMKDTAKTWEPPPGEPTHILTQTAKEERSRPARTVMPVDSVEALPRIYNLDYGSEVELAEKLAEQIQTLGPAVFCEGAFWIFRGTEWRRIPEATLELAVHKFNGASLPKGIVKVGSGMVKGTLKCLSSILSADGFFDRVKVGVNALNGTITIDDSGEILVVPHNSDDRFRFTIKAELRRDAHEPPAGSLLHKLLSGSFKGDDDADDKINLIGEILGAAAFGMATRLKQPKAFTFLGESASKGKSTIAGLLSCLLPAGAVSAISTAKLSDERYIVNLAGKAANVANEISASGISGEAFKSVVTGDPMEGRDVYRSAFTFIPRAVHVYTTNRLPTFTGGLDRGLQRRLVVVQFNRTIPADEVIPDILDRIKCEELGLLLGFAVAGAKRLKENGGYTIPASSVEALREWMRIDPINEWFEMRVEKLEEQPYGGWLKTVDLYNDFKKWAGGEGHKEAFLPAVTTFGQRLRTLPGITVKRLSTGPIAIGVWLKGVRDEVF